MTINEHLATIRLLVNNYDDDSEYTDPALYALLKNAAAIVNKRKADKRHKLSDWNYNHFLVGMHSASPWEDDCLDEVCHKWISKYKIPRPLQARNNLLLDIRTIDNDPISKISRDEELKCLSPIKKNAKGYYIENGYLVYVGPKPNPLALKVGGVWADITEWENKKLCDTQGNELDVSCYNIRNDEFPVDDDYTFMMYDLVLEKLGIKMQMNEIKNIAVNENHPS